MGGSSSAGRSSFHRGLLALILLSGLALRVVYALSEPNIARFEDEKHALDNVVGIVLDGSLRPVKNYYPSPVFNLPPSALVALSNALHRFTGDRRFLAVDDEGVCHPAAFLLCRLLMAAYGTLALWLAFLIGRRLFSARVGLLAAAMLAFTPWMIHSSGNFKPDPLLLLTVLLAFWASLRAAADLRLRSYLIAGVAIALAASSKLTGALIAVPLVLATILGWRERRRWALLAAAGATTLVSFVLLNPWWWAYPRFLAGLRRDYAMRAGWDSMTRIEIPGRVLDLMLGGTGHGPIVGILALVGWCALLLEALRRRTAAAERDGLAMLLVFPPVYVFAYAVQTPYYKSNNFLPVLAFTALPAAWAVASAWSWARRRWPVLARRGGAMMAVVGGALLLVPPGPGYVYESLVPSTEDMVRLLLRNRLAPAQGRSVVIEPEARRGSIWEGGVRFRVAQIEVQQLHELPPASLDMADAEIFAESRLRGRDADFYRRRVERLPDDQAQTFRARFPSLRGPALVALVHRRTRLGAPRRLRLERCDAAPTCFDARLPADMMPRERFSLTARLPPRLAPVADSPLPILVGDRQVDLIEVQRSQNSVHAATARLFVDDPAAAVLRLSAEHTARRQPRIWLLRWAGGPRPAPEGANR